MSKAFFKVLVHLESRDDGGLRAWSDDVPEIVMSHSRPELVLLDIPMALEVILSERLGVEIEVDELLPLTVASGGERPLDHREYAARAR